MPKTVSFSPSKISVFCHVCDEDIESFGEKEECDKSGNEIESVGEDVARVFQRSCSRQGASESCPSSRRDADCDCPLRCVYVCVYVCLCFWFSLREFSYA